MTGMIEKLNSLLQKKKISCIELTRAYLNGIARDNGVLNAYVRVTEERALETAAVVDHKLAAGQILSPLEGIPMTLKDNISTRGVETTCCSKILQGYTPIYDASVWQTLKRQNAVLLGKTNMDEFAMGSSCETSCYGGAVNPFDIDCVAGGSSGGGAAAVAGNLAAYALGSDTGGSIRQPAGFCGLVGLKPTYGTVSRFGLIAYASSLDQIGPLCKSVADAALVFDAISCQDPMDSTSIGQKEPTWPQLTQKPEKLIIGIVKEYFKGVNPQIEKALQNAVHTYEKMGAEIVKLSMPAVSYALPVYYILACAEASSNLGRYDGIRYGYRTKHYNSVYEMICKTRSEGFGPEVQRRILLGSYVLSAGYYDAYYKKEQNLRGAVVQGFDEAFSRCDVILAPTVPATAFPKGFAAQDQVQTYQTDVCTVPVNIAGIPALSMPCGYDKKGLPIGMQLIANRFEEAKLLQIAYQFEQATDGEFYRKTKWGCCQYA